MAIGTGAVIDFFGTQDTATLATGTAAVNDSSFSVVGDVVVGGWTNDDDAKSASMVLTFQYPSGTITSKGIHLYARKMNVDGTSDEAIPDANNKAGYVGTFITDAGMAAVTNVPHTLKIPLDNNNTSQVYEFYVENTCGVTMTAGWTLKPTPLADGSHA